MTIPQPYPEYRESEIDWIGEIPKDWEIVRVKNVSIVNPSKNHLRSLSEDLEVTFLPMESIGDDGSIDTSKTKKLGDVINGYTYVAEGDICIAKITPCFENGKGAIVTGLKNQISFATTEVVAIRPESSANASFLYYLLISRPFKNIAEGSMYGAGGQKRVADSFVENYHFSCPTEEEQKKITNFLDHETAKIDTLIEKQQQLIKLIKEKRQAVISHAVTKGLDPDAPMRDSGVEWLGEVPTHWTVSKFGYVSEVVRGGSPRPAGDPLLFDGDYSPWVTVAEITKDDDVYLSNTESFLTKKGSEQCRVFKAGTLLLSNSGATLGVPKILNIDANANDGVVGFERLKVNILYAYYFLYFQTDDLRERTKQGSGQPNLNTDIVQEIALTIPPEHEVDKIVEFIVRNENKYSNLLVQARKGISLLTERKTTLISAAVTGKIDVRNWEPPK